MLKYQVPMTSVMGIVAMDPEYIRHRKRNHGLEYRLHVRVLGP